MDIVMPPERASGRPVSVTRRIAAPASDVWAVISMPGNLEPCHPFCAKNPVQRWPGPESRDEVHYLNGWIFERRFRDWIDGIGYDLEIGRRGGRSSFVEWRVLDGGRECSLKITVHPYRVDGVPAVLRWPAHLLYVRPMLTRYLSSVIRGFEWYVTRGEPVPRNQFGRHRWFSAPISDASS